MTTAAQLPPLSDGEPASVRFADLLADPMTAERFEKVRQFFFLRESAYDMTSRCNVRCDGCYYFEGDKQHTRDELGPSAWRSLMQAEKGRGITFVVLAGAEPALVPELMQVCYEEIPHGAIATNGLLRIPDSVKYRIHVSVWGNDATSERTRKAKRMLERQLEHYEGDARAVFVYTYTRHNVEEADEVVARLAKAGCRCTFNVFSAPLGYAGELRHTPASLAAMRASMLRLLAAHPDSVLYSPYNAAAHTNEKGLHDLFRCPYPRSAGSIAFGLGRSFRQYRSDLSWVHEASCCVPDTECSDCRHYAAGSAMVTARMQRHARTHEHFRAWLDYVDTYLAVWVNGYAKGVNLAGWVSPPDVSKVHAAADSGRERRAHAVPTKCRR